MKNYSRQRNELLELLKSSKAHPTAETLYNLLKESGSTSSRGTVYRNLKDLVSDGTIIKISMADGADRYDYIHKKHNHIICKVCGRVMDFTYNFNSSKAILAVSEQTKMETNIESVIIYGICRECKNKR